MGSFETNTNFRPTNWTLVARSKDGGTALEELLQTYVNPIYAYLRRRGVNSNDACDLTQSFIADRMIKKNLAEHATKRQGRFRSLIITALKQHVVDQHRALHGRSRKAKTVIPGDSVVLDLTEPSDADSPETAFDRGWAGGLLEAALAQVRQACRENDMDMHWSAFEQRVYLPISTGNAPPTLPELAAQLGVDQPEKLSSMILSVKRRVRAAYRDIVLDTLSDANELGDELAILSTFLQMPAK